MKKNMGSLDKRIRLLLALIIGVLVYFEIVGAIASYVLLALASVLVITSLVGFCPLYGLFGWNSCSRKED